MKDFSEQLKKVMELRGISQTELCEKTGIPKSAMSQYLSGAFKPKQARTYLLAEALRTTPEYLMGTIDNPDITTPYPRNATPATQIERSPVQFWGKVSAGIGAYAEGTAIRTMPANDEDMLDGYDYAWLEVEGDSMSPDLQDGDYVLVRVQDTAENGDVIVALIDGGCEHDGVVKRLEIEPGSHLALISINPAYPPRIFVGEQMNAVHIFGVVVTSQRRWR